jgi:serine/threonine-protein kinase
MGPVEPDADENLPTTDTITPVLLKNRYLLGPELGRGGFGVTYLARDKDVGGRKVVVKVLNEARSRSDWHWKKFRGEMEALSRIDHPNVVGVIDYWESTDRQQFLVLQFVPGETLRRLIRGEPIPLPVIAQIVRQIGCALTAAHDAGVIHRDVKPENIMLRTSTDAGYQVRLIDFGISAIRASDAIPSTAKLCGTFSYMAPEQFEGKSSVASDIYQMGIVAYELSTRIVPFRAADPAGVARQQKEGLKIGPRQLREELSERAEAAILKALSIDPADRFHSAKEFGDAVASALEEGVLAPASWVNRQPRGPRAVFGPRAAIVVALILLLSLGAWEYFRFAPKLAASDLIAVLPFENRTGDSDLAYLTDGITESLIGDLSRIPAVRVSALGSVLKYQGQRADVRVAGRELAAGRVIAGSISWRDGALFVDTELIDVPTGARLWGNAYSADVSTISEVLERFSSEVTDQLRLKLSGSLRDRLRRQYAVGSHSYEKYLKARHHIVKRTAADFEQALQYFEEVLATDPDYAPARAGLANTYARMAVYGPYGGGLESREGFERARQAARRALQLDGTLAEAYAARALVETYADYNWAAAESDYRRAIELNPNFGEAHEDYAFELAATGRSQGAIREIHLAEELEPDDNRFRAAHAVILYVARQYDESLKIYFDIAKTPEAAARVANVMIWDYWMKNNPDEALRILDRVPGTLPEVRTPLLVATLCRMGKMDQATLLHDRYYLHGGKPLWYDLAAADMNMGRLVDAIRDLEKAYEERMGDAIWTGTDPKFDVLRSKPRFRQLLARMKLGSKL